LELVSAFLVSILCLTVCAFTSHPAPVSRATKEVWILYVGTWGNPATDGNWSGWNRKTDQWEGSSFVPPHELPSRHYPQLGAYSSHDESTLRAHLSLLKNASIDVLVVPWDGPFSSNFTSSFSEATLRLLFKLAPSFSLKIMPLVPLFQDRNLTTMRSDFQSYVARFLNEPAHYRRAGLPVAVVHDAHELKQGAEFVDEMRDRMSFVATALSLQHVIDAFEDGYLGITTFFPSDEAGWAANHRNWKAAAAGARERGVMFVPTVSPGFDDSLVSHWNGKWIRSRNCAGYYDARWAAAIETAPDVVMINSFNNWLEGSGIEPAVEKGNYSLSDDIWCGKDPDFFIRRTAEWVAKFREEVE
jgi:glycoprotein endo-alpha-1,2-mannosidase